MHLPIGGTSGTEMGNSMQIFSGAEGAGNSFLHGYRLFFKGGIDSILLSQLGAAGIWEDVK